MLRCRSPSLVMSQLEQPNKEERGEIDKDNRDTSTPLSDFWMQTNELKYLFKRCFSHLAKFHKETWRKKRVWKEQKK